MADSFQFQSAPKQAELDSLRIQSRQDAPPPSGPRVNVPHNGRVTMVAGEARQESFEPVRAQLETGRPGMVRIGGIETTRAAAIAAGLLSEDGGEADAEPSPRSPGNRGEPRRAGDERGTEQESESSPAEVEAAGRILQAAAEVHGSEAVTDALYGVADAGEVPTTLPEGVSAAEAQAVWTGYHVQAQHTLGEIGGSVELLSEMLSDAELRRARMATFSSNAAELHDLGRQAQSRLASLPEKDPQHFQELIGTLPTEWRDKVRGDDNGRWSIDLGPEHGTLSWGAAVRAGYVKF